MLSALSWVNREHICPVPRRLKITEEEARKIIDEHSLYISASSIDMVRNSIASDDTCSNSESDISPIEMGMNEHEAKSDEFIVKKYNLDEYPEDALSSLSITSENDAMSTKYDLEKIFSGFGGLSLFSSENPYSIMNSINRNSDDDYFDEDDLDDLTVRPTDFLLISARTPEDDDIAHLEYYLYEEVEDNLYVHHDIMLPSFPLCLEWSDYPLHTEHEHGIGHKVILGNFVAVGSFDPGIEIWDLNVLDPIYPTIVLGKATRKSGKARKEKRTSKKIHLYTHTDAILSISWNRITKSLLVSGSADTTIKLWDLNYPERALRSYHSHTDKVSSLSFSPNDAPMIASVSFDKSCKFFDMRDPSSIISVPLQSDGEVVKWDPFNKHVLAVGDDDGNLYHIDNRYPKLSFGTFKAHSKQISSIDFNPMLPGILLSTSFDKHLKIWDTIDPATYIPIFDKKANSGRILSGSFCPNSPFLLSYIGSTSQDPGVLNLSNCKNYKSDSQFEKMRLLFTERLNRIRH